MKIYLPTVDSVIEVNKYICLQGKNPYHCREVGKIESAICTAFYPGSPPFVHGGITDNILLT